MPTKNKLTRRHNFVHCLPSILSGTDSAGLGGPLFKSLSSVGMIWFDVKSRSKSNNQKQSKDKIDMQFRTNFLEIKSAILNGDKGIQTLI